MPGEGRKDRFHVKGALALEDLFLKLGLPVDPTLRERSLPTVEVAHPLPREMGGSYEERADLLVGEAVLAVHFLPDCLLACDGKRHIDAVEGHPVDESLPLLPFPPGHGIAEGAVVEEEPLGDIGRSAHRLGDCGQCCRKLHRVEVVPADIGQAVLLEVAVEAYRHRIGVICFDKNLGAILTEFVAVFFGFDLLEDYCSGLRAHNALCKGCSLLFVCCPARYERQCDCRSEG